MSFFAVYLKSKRVIVVKEDWIQNPKVGKESVVFISPDENAEADYNIPREYFINPNSNGCFDGYLMKKFENEDDANLYAAKKRKIDPIEYKKCDRFESGLATNQVVAIIDLSDDEENASDETPVDMTDSSSANIPEEIVSAMASDRASENVQNTLTLSIDSIHDGNGVLSCVSEPVDVFNSDTIELATSSAHAASDTNMTNTTTGTVQPTGLTLSIDSMEGIGDENGELSNVSVRVDESDSDATGSAHSASGASMTITTTETVQDIEMTLSIDSMEATGGENEDLSNVPEPVDVFDSDTIELATGSAHAASDTSMTNTRTVQQTGLTSMEGTGDENGELSNVPDRVNETTVSDADAVDRASSSNIIVQEIDVSATTESNTGGVAGNVESFSAMDSFAVGYQYLEGTNGGRFYTLPSVTIRADQMRKLRNVKKEFGFDASFISNLLAIVFGDDVLSVSSVGGGKSNFNGKQSAPLDAVKLQFVQTVFNGRVGNDRNRQKKFIKVVNKKCHNSRRFK